LPNLLLIEVPGASQPMWNHALPVSTLWTNSLSGRGGADVTANIRCERLLDLEMPTTDAAGPFVTLFATVQPQPASGPVALPNLVPPGNVGCFNRLHKRAVNTAMTFE
jgi:hypothetical protein